MLKKLEGNTCFISLDKLSFRMLTVQCYCLFCFYLNRASTFCCCCPVQEGLTSPNVSVLDSGVVELVVCICVGVFLRMLCVSQVLRLKGGIAPHLFH